MYICNTFNSCSQSYRFVASYTISRYEYALNVEESKQCCVADAISSSICTVFFRRSPNSAVSKGMHHFPQYPRSRTELRSYSLACECVKSCAVVVCLRFFGGGAHFFYRYFCYHLRHVDVKFVTMNKNAWCAFLRCHLQ